MFDAIVPLAVVLIGSSAIALLALLFGALFVARGAALFGVERERELTRNTHPARRSALVGASHPQSSPVPL